MILQYQTYSIANTILNNIMSNIKCEIENQTYWH